MLGIIGFIAAALTFFLYGYTSARIARGMSFSSRDYYISYILVAVGCLAWAMAVILQDNILAWVLIGDAFLILASGFLLNSLFPRKVTLPYILILAVVIYGFLTVRLLGTGLEPVVRDGVLIFNTPRLFGFLLSVVLLLIWVRANMNFYSKVVDKKFPLVLRPAYFSMNLLGFISVVAFLMARKNITIVTAFILLVSSFAMLALMNHYVQGLIARKEVRHAE